MRRYLLIFFLLFSVMPSVWAKGGTTTYTISGGVTSTTGVYGSVHGVAGDPIQLCVGGDG